MVALNRDSMLIKIRDKVIDLGLESVQSEKEESARVGGKKGFEQCRELVTREDFERRIYDLNCEMEELRCQ